MAEPEEPNLAAGGRRDAMQAQTAGQVLRRAAFNTARANQVGVQEGFIQITRVNEVRAG